MALEDLLGEVEKPGRYSGNEWGAVRRDPQGVKVKVALGFPDLYEVGMSHLGSKILYHEILRRSDALVERFFSPAEDMEARLRTEGLPLFSLESRRPIREFDLVAITLQHEFVFTNVLNLLDLAGLPVLAKERGPLHPLIMGGGPAAMNPEPMSDFFDLFVHGDGEEVLAEILDLFVVWSEDSRPGGREGLLHRLAGLEGVYIPSLYAPVYQADGRLLGTFPTEVGLPRQIRRRVVRDLETLDFPTDPVVPNVEIIHDRAVLEILRGCTRGCRFCQAGYIYRPVRERSPEQVVELAVELVHRSGYEEISLSSLSSADYVALPWVLKELRRRLGPEVTISLPSLRVDSFSVELARELGRGRPAGLTLAPEAGTQRLREVINKGITEGDIEGAVRTAFRGGWRQLKLYFMIGLPTETDDDLLGLAALVRRILGFYQEETGRRDLKLAVSLAAFVPKSHTPFQWVTQVSEAELERRRRLVAENLRDRRVDLRWHDPRQSYWEGFLARGDRRVGEVILGAWRRGATFDSWTDHFRPELWAAAARAADLDPAFYGLRERPQDEVFPWAHIDSGVEREYLWGEYQEALAGRARIDCRSDCDLCGVCPSFGVDMIFREGKLGEPLSN